MQLRKAFGAVALGVTVLTAVPAIALPQAAFASDCYTSCDPWDNNDPNDTIVVIGHPQPEGPGPGPGVIFPGGGGGSGATAVVYSKGQTWEEQEFCRRNTNTIPERLSTTVQYNTSFKITASISSEALTALKASLGAEVNTSVTRTHSLDATLNPGQSLGVFVEIQTNVYQITTYDFTGQQHVDYINVTAPTGVVTDHAC
ncbi:DUF6426 family protein [Kitasatospora sp. NPDC048540]|uniref:DUF6426 family protein n=1 Tax=unclassified Kitasatospora TaxID=2633591 RepID=UPI0005397D5A|nr:DUF6426 family protein [Kitasatospora sp. MBT63]